MRDVDLGKGLLGRGQAGQGQTPEARVYLARWSRSTARRIKITIRIVTAFPKWSEHRAFLHGVEQLPLAKAVSQPVCC